MNNHENHTAESFSKELKQAIENIRAKYEKTEPRKLDELKELDRKVKRPAYVFAYTYGTVGALTLGAGMSMAMKVILSSLSFVMPLGIAIGVLGIAITATTYPIFKAILNARRTHYREQILALSNELLHKEA